MTRSTTNLAKNLWQFADSYIEKYKAEHHQLPKIELDEEWPSPCIVNTILANDSESQDGDYGYWQPAKADHHLSFENVEEALSFTLHSDIKTLFTTFYSEGMNAHCSEGNLTLLFAWNKDDFDRLQENLIGHVLMKQKLKQQITLFFAVTDEEDTIVSVVNDTGEVWVERVGRNPHKKIANSLSEFMSSLTPIV